MIPLGLYSTLTSHVKLQKLFFKHKLTFKYIYTLNFNLLFLNAKQPPTILKCCFLHLFHWYLLNLCDLFGHKTDIGGLVSLPR